MNKKVKWYACKRDIGITLMLMTVAFYHWPWLLKGKIDGDLLVFVYVIILVFIECLLICRNHFWVWSSIALYGITTACCLGEASLHYLTIANQKELVFAALYALYLAVLVLPIVVPMAVFIFKSSEKTTKFSVFMLLWPIGWLAGILFTDKHYKIHTESIFGLAMDTAVGLALISAIIFAVAANVDDITTDLKKHTYLKWISILSWLPAGLIPGSIYLGWKYSLFATVLPIATIYYFFELSKQEVKERQDKQMKILE